MIIPTLQIETGFLYEIGENVGLGFEFGASYLQRQDETEKSTYAGSVTNSVLKDGYSIGGLAYNVSLGVNFNFGMGRGSKKEKALSKAEEIKLKKKYWQKAVSYYNKVKYEKAIFWWEKILEIDPDHKESLLRIEKARSEMKKAWGN